MKLQRLFMAILGSIVLTAAASCAKANRSDEMRFEGKTAAPMAGRAFAKVALAESAAADMAAPSAQIASDAASAGGASSAPIPVPPPMNARDERKLVRTASLRLRVTDLAATETAAEALVGRLGGYIASSNKSEESLSMSLRVPRSAFDAALAGIAPLGVELWRNVNTEDVTLHWFDLEGRLETKRELMTTLRGYLRSAKSIEDIMAVETRLADLQNEIDSLGGEFRRLADLVDFATIHVEFVLPAAAVRSIEPGLGERIGEVLRKTGAFFSSLAAFIVGFIVFGVPLIGLAALLFWLLFGKVGLLIALYRAVAKPGKAKRKDGGSK